MIQRLLQMKVCNPALEWVTENNIKNIQEAWELCPRADWMIWLAKELGVERRLLILTTARCAEPILHLMQDERSRNAVHVAIAYGEGKATKEELEAATSAADKARSDAYVAYKPSGYTRSTANKDYFAGYDAISLKQAADNAAYFAAIVAVAAIVGNSVAPDYVADAIAADIVAKAIKNVKVNQQQSVEICRNILTEVMLPHFKTFN